MENPDLHNPEFLNFDIVYKLGRIIDREFNPEEKNIEINDLSSFSFPQNEINELNTFISDLLILIKSFPGKLVPGLIEFSVYDPQDQLGNIFYSIVISTSSAVCETYRDEMGCNLVKSQDDNSQSVRLPLLPNYNLYRLSTYYHLAPPPSFEVLFEELNPNHCEVFIGKFESDYLKYSTTELENNIDQFFNDVYIRLASNPPVSNENLSNIYNTSLLLPLNKPAGTFNIKDQNRYNGGGLFILGETKEDFNFDKYCIFLLNVIYKKIFDISFAASNIRHLTESQYYTNYKILHGLKNKLGLEMITKLEKLIDEIEVPDQQLKVLNILNKRLTGQYDAISDFLNAHNRIIENIKNDRKFTADIVSIIKKYKKDRIHEFEKIGRIELKSENESMNIVVFDDLESQPILFNQVLDNILSNAENYYNKYNTNKSNSIVYINIKNHVSDSRLITISLTSKNTTFPKKYINSYGVRPLASSKKGNGWGLVNINHNLGLLGSVRNSKNKYLNIFNSENIGCTYNFDFIKKQN